MNGIVTGKIEKTAGSMVFKSEYSEPIPSGTFIMSIYIPSANTYVKIVDKAGNVILMRAYNAPRGTGSDYDGAFTFWQADNDKDQAFFWCNYDNAPNASFVIKMSSSYSYLPNYLTSVERGTLEIA